ncbi:MAG: hypothetical protein Rsou_0077 [Candidatus Ruthia sp. Asou_11_S2]|nr:hypothetical protein [Candidatus Ruthia sp. Asou_11_S2]
MLASLGSPPTFADFGSTATFNAAYTSSSLPTTNHFGDEAEYNYTYTVSPTVSISTRVPIDEAEPVGFIANSLENSSATSTILTVYPRAKLEKNQLGRLNWNKQFYYQQDYEQLKEKQNLGNFKANYLTGKYAP